MSKKPTSTNIRYLAILWAGGLIFCFLVLSVSLILTTDRLQSMNSQILEDSRSLELAHRLEIELLRERQQFGGSHKNHEANLDKIKLGMKTAESLIDEMGRMSDDPEQKQLLEDIKSRFQSFRKAEVSENKGLETGNSRKAGDLFKAIELYRDWDRKQLDRTITASDHLGVVVNRWSLILVVLMAVVLALGTITFLFRVLQPSFALMHASSRLAEGDFSTRVPVYRDDEIGDLCRSFNEMADGICRLENERLNIVAAVAHDLRNPLCVIGMAARRIKKKTPDQGDTSTWLERIIEKTEYIDDLINDLMDSARIKSGNISLDVEEFELASLAQGIVQEQNELVETHRLVFEGDFQCMLRGDARRLKSVIENLVSNAIKYSPENSTVTLRVCKKGSFALVEVDNEGSSISEDETSSLFKPFSRLSRTAGMAKGMGLGLFSAKLVVEAHNGQLNLIGNPGGGTTARIVLPLFLSNTNVECI